MSRRSVEQRGPQFALQPADLLTHRGTADVQPVGSPPEMPLLGHRDEVLDLTQLHGESCYRGMPSRASTAAVTRAGAVVSAPP